MIQKDGLTCGKAVDSHGKGLPDGKAITDDGKDKKPSDEIVHTLEELVHILTPLTQGERKRLLATVCVFYSISFEITAPFPDDK